MITKTMIKDALRYMGTPEEKADQKLKQNIEEMFERLDAIASPKYSYRKIEVALNSEEGVCFENGALLIKSKDLYKLFNHSKTCFILAATMGKEVDRQISLLQRTDMLEAVMLDACASVKIDALCDEIELEMMEKIGETEYLTMRFSPGYGDVPLELSEHLLEWLQAGKRVGLSLTKSHMLIPTKSVTALIGISNQKENRQKSCGICNLVKTCMYRRRGMRCGL